ncbi:hypothetical protein [Bartonella sp. HY761]|uniref:hypothetical protein n=1 Tax=Bartonella sp. HY761 TaxID=2979330 RepID=UPI002208531C|nr:hypothetical protein [Bartonella sp. HY761]UXN07518.1 hypothetical protein N6A79_05910 [Bartonella sp. HY761]
MARNAKTVKEADDKALDEAALNALTNEQELEPELESDVESGEADIISPNDINPNDAVSDESQPTDETAGIKLQSYKVLSPLKCGGERLAVGTIVEFDLDAAQITNLVASGTIKPV